MDNYDEYLEKGTEMLYDGVLDGILEIKDKTVRNAMLRFWSGELTFEEHVEVIADDITKRSQEKINKLMCGEISNKDRFKIYINKISK